MFGRWRNKQSPQGSLPQAAEQPATPAQKSYQNEEKVLGEPQYHLSIDPRDAGLIDSIQSGWFGKENHELLQGFAISSSDVVVDVGCGEGGSTTFCARRAAKVIFCDSEPEKIATLEQRVQEIGVAQGQGIVSDSVPLPLPDAVADKVICMEMLEHVPQPQQVVAELVRIAKPGALLLISVPAAQSEKLQQHIAPALHFQPPNHIHIFEQAEFHQLITDAGLEIVRTHASGFYWSLWMLFYWASEKQAGTQFSGATLDKIAPPFHPLLQHWADTWHRLITMPEGAAVKQALDALLPKSQAVIARKPGPTDEQG